MNKVGTEGNDMATIVTFHNMRCVENILVPLYEFVKIERINTMVLLCGRDISQYPISSLG